MSDVGYPLMRRWKLGVARGVVNRNRARLLDVPTDRAGFAVVLDVDGMLEPVPDGVALQRADNIRRASSAIFVDLRPQNVRTSVAVPCSGGHREFDVDVVYYCEVSDPVTVVERRADNVPEELNTWTAAALRRCCDGFVLEDAMECEPYAEETLRLAFREKPPLCSTWMDVELRSVAVPLAQKYRDAANEIEDITLTTSRQGHELNEAERLARV